MDNPGFVLCVPGERELIPLADETVLDAALRCHVPLASSCAGNAVCGDCVVRILAGEANVNPPDDDERAWRKRAGITTDVRLACCLRVTGPVEVTTTYW